MRNPQINPWGHWWGHPDTRRVEKNPGPPTRPTQPSVNEATSALLGAALHCKRSASHSLSAHTFRLVVDSVV